MFRVVNAQGRILELPPDQVISVDRFNPLFNDPDKFFQDISYPIVAPFTENNKLFFQMGNLPEASKDVYLLPAKFYADEIQMVSGNIRYRVGINGFEANLEPNFAAINSLIKNIRLTEIITEDANYNFAGSADFEAMMLDSCINPDKYGYIFFPVYNPGFGQGTATIQGKSYQFINQYDPPSGQFKTTPINSSFVCAQSPYFKVSYILKQIAAYLGFTVSGSFFTDPDTKNICIYTRYSEYEYQVQPCMKYMPNMLISDFLKQVRERMHVAMDFDLVSAALTVETFKAIKKKAKVVDLTTYMSDSLEQEVPAQQSFTVTLKSDEQDENFKVIDSAGKDTYPPFFTLVVGDGDTPQELDCSTTKFIDLSAGGQPGSKYPSVNQSVFNQSAWIFLPPDMALSDINDPTTLNNWPLRLINYLGYQPAGPYMYPNAISYDLNDDDEEYYQFLNDSKRLIINANMPASILGSLKATDKFTHRTAANNYVQYIIEQIAYDAKQVMDLIPVKIYARTLAYLDNTKITNTPLSPIVATAGYVYNVAQVKAYFDQALHGISRLSMQIVSTTGDVFTIADITSPSNIKGSGGIASAVVSANGYIGGTIELRITQGKPKYIIHRGIRTYFTAAGNYWAVTIDYMNDYNKGIFDFYTIFF